MNCAQAQRVIESFRKGIPPDGFVRHFTVGRTSEIKQLIDRLDKAAPGALLLKANYGSGKTHLLRFIRECALEKGFAVSAVTLDSKGAVRFNRMDQVFGAICRNIEIPSVSGKKGIRPVLDHVADQLNCAKSANLKGFWRELSNNWRWDYSEVLDSPAAFVAVRAWVTGKPNVRDRVEDWFQQPWTFYNQRSRLYSELVIGLSRFFRDPRSDVHFYSNGVFNFKNQDYTQSWAALRDLQRLLREAGFKGLVLLFDEFEDVLTNLGNISHQESAFWNLFKFYSGKEFPGLSFYAVTPEFVDKCISLLTKKKRSGYNQEQLKAVPTFEMTPLDVEELKELAMRILETHGIAYDWEPDLVMRAKELDHIVRKAASVQIQDRARHTIIAVVKALDRLLEEHT